MKQHPNQSFVPDVFTTPIRIQDVASMFRAPISPNEKPYAAIVKKLNNEKIDDWYDKVLIPLGGTSGKIHAGQAVPAFQAYIEGKELLSSVKYYDKIPRATEEQINFWAALLRESSIEQLHALGVGTVAMGWSLLNNELRLSFAERKLEKVYIRSDDPLQWYKLANEYPSLFNGRDVPFGWTKEIYDEVAEKVITLLSIKIEPRN